MPTTRRSQARDFLSGDTVAGRNTRSIHNAIDFFGGIAERFADVVNSFAPRGSHGFVTKFSVGIPERLWPTFINALNTHWRAQTATVDGDKATIRPTGHSEIDFYSCRSLEPQPYEPPTSINRFDPFAVDSPRFNNPNMYWASSGTHVVSIAEDNGVTHRPDEASAPIGVLSTPQSEPYPEQQEQEPDEQSLNEAQDNLGPDRDSNYDEP